VVIVVVVAVVAVVVVVVVVVVVAVGIVAAIVVASSRMSWNTSFTIELGYGTEDLGSIPDRKKSFLALRHVEFYLQLYVGGKKVMPGNAFRC
jgi:cell division protein YceG involved in septum cleavage